jgi:SdiA-regulated
MKKLPLPISKHIHQAIFNSTCGAIILTANLFSSTATYAFDQTASDGTNLFHPPIPLSAYDLDEPVSTHVLSNALHEVSGIESLGSDRIAAQQDEVGTIFIYDLNERRVVDTIDFQERGDFEAVAQLRNGPYYLLRSDGLLIELDPATSKSNRYKLDTDAKNNEGLAYDPVTNTLLVATKSKAGRGKEAKDRRVVYMFDLETKRLRAEPLFVIDIDDIKAYLGDRGSKRNFRPSAITVHPTSHNIYIISAVDHIVVEFDRSGSIVGAKILDRELLNRPEGMAFDTSLNLLVANEGGDGVPRLLEFSYGKQI